MAIFNSYISLPEGMCWGSKKRPKTKRGRNRLVIHTEAARASARGFRLCHGLQNDVMACLY